MKAAVVKGVRDINIEEMNRPQPAENEVLLKVHMAGICGSDYSIFTGKMPVNYPVVPGHEAVGTIEAVGKGVKKLQPGQRATIHPNYFCGQCLPCRKGLTNVCLSKTRLGIDINGVFAEYAAIPEDALYALPDSLPDEVAVFTEPLSVAAHGLNRVSPGEGERVLIFGAGVIGQLTLQLVMSKSRDITACDLVGSRLDLAEKMGAKQTIGADGSLEDLESSFDVIYESTGAPQALDLATKLAAQGGRIVLLGIPGEEHPVSTVRIVRKELTIVGSMIYTDEFNQSIELLEKGLVKTEPLTSGIVPLEKLHDNLENFNAPRRMKTLVAI
jgi:2-desacetyl-2-hydroxyethyl bacteriochlorophyllide A dehydrogenase